MLALKGVASPLGYLLRRASIGAGRLSDDLADQPGGAGGGGFDWGTRLSSQLRELGVLVVLERFGASSQHELAGRLGINRSVMVKIVDSLEQAGDVERHRDTSDRRSYSLLLTASGRERSVELSRRAEQVGVALTGALPPARRRRLVLLLGRLVSSNAPSPFPPELLKMPVWLVSKAQELLEDLGNRGLVDLRLTVRIYIALAISTSRRCTQADLASSMMIGPAAAVDLVDQAEALGALRRVRDTTDRRSYRLELTPEGTALLARASATVARLTGEFTRALSRQEVTELIGLLSAMIEGG